jgi:hypothetical protein
MRGEKHRRESCPEIAENNLAMATVAFDSHRTIFHSLAGTRWPTQYDASEPQWV